MRNCFVTPDTRTLPLFDDGQFTITVKAQLNAQETKLLHGGVLRSMTPGKGDDSASFAVDFVEAAFNKVMVYLVDWTLTRNGKTVEIDTPKAMSDALHSLHPELFAEIERVIDVHAAANEKKVQSGLPTPATT